MTYAPPPPPPHADPPPWEAPPPASSGDRQLRRSTDEKMAGGVCGGLADYSGIDPLLWRIGFVALALMGPGVFVYLLLWVLVPAGPAGPEEVAPIERLVQRLHDQLTTLLGNRTARF